MLAHICCPFGFMSSHCAFCPNAGGVYGPAGIQATYAPGQVIDISILVSARHGGRWVFRVCPSTNADEACLSQYVLQR